MSKVVWVVLLVVLAILLVGGIYMINQSKDSRTSNNNIVNNNNLNSNKQIENSNARQNLVDISNFVFSPSTLNIKVGDSVTWTNKDSAMHSIKSDSGSELSSSSFGNGERYTHVFAAAGTYAYHCGVHPGMKGKIIVS